MVDNQPSEIQIIQQLMSAPEVEQAQAAEALWLNETTAGRFFGGEFISEAALNDYELTNESFATLFRKKGYPNEIALEEAYFQFRATQSIAEDFIDNETSAGDISLHRKLAASLSMDLRNRLLTSEEIFGIISRLDPAFEETKVPSCIDQFSNDWGQCDADYDSANSNQDIPLSNDYDDYIACQNSAISAYNNCTGNSNSPTVRSDQYLSGY